MRVRRPWRWVLFLLITALLTAAVVYTAVEPLLRFWHSQADATRDVSTLRTFSVLEEIRIRVFEVFTFAWVFMFGATVGSFLNVVAYRMPRSESIIWRASHCPYCDQPIRATDNVPIFGWLWLGGRCRTCRLPISPRYPIVELITAIIFATLAYVEPFSGGTNLPGRGDVASYYGLTQTILDTRWDLVAIYAYHTLLLSVLLSVTLMRWDDQRVPWRLALTTGLIGLAAAVAWPDLQPVRWDGRVIAALTPDVSLLDRVATSLLGLAAGGFAGAIATGIASRLSGSSQSSGLLLSGVLVGLFLGWQASSSAIALSLLMGLPAVGLLRLALCATRVPAAAYLLLGVLLQVCFWKYLVW